jgi:hypothetical protein
MDSHACVCILKKLLLTCNYDYNINIRFEKGDNNSLTFKLVNTLA